MLTTANPFDAKIILDGIRGWVEVETPTEAPEQVNKLAKLVMEGYRDLPVTIERIAGHSGCGDHIVARSSWGQDEPGILVLSHLDTVHPLGFIERLPFRIEGDSAFGPGIYDMKGGAYLAYHAFRQLCTSGAHSPLGVTQAGSRPEDGRSAIRELANIIQTLEAMNDIKRGVTVNVGVVRGGTKPNVIAEEAYAEVDMRVPTTADADDLVPKILNLKSQTEGVSVKVTGELNRPPYEKGNAGAALYQHAKSLAAEIGFDLVDTSTAGGSDGNFTAPYTATLDGLGVDGKGAHTHYEQLYISSIEPRARLLHRLYQTLR